MPMSVSRVTHDGASSVWRRGEHQVSRLCGLHRDSRCLLIADLADENHVGILTQNRPQRARERQVDLGIDLRLIDARNLVLNRILDRDNVGPLRANIDASADDSVVVLPDPVGPTTRTMPC